MGIHSITCPAAVMSSGPKTLVQSHYLSLSNVIPYSNTFFCSKSCIATPQKTLRSYQGFAVNAELQLSVEDQTAADVSQYKNMLFQSMTDKNPYPSDGTIQNSTLKHKKSNYIKEKHQWFYLSIVKWRVKSQPSSKQTNIVEASQAALPRIWGIKNTNDGLSRLLGGLLLPIYSFRMLIYSKSLMKKLQSRNLLRRIGSLFFISAIGFLVSMTSLPVDKSPALARALTQEKLLFLEAWKTIDRAYIDKKFNGQGWFRYREDALRREPMNTREQTYAAIRKMIASLDDPFTRFLEPEKFKSLRSSSTGSLTGVGVELGLGTDISDSSANLIVISCVAGSPARRAGLMPGDIIVDINGINTKGIGLYDAAELLQGPEDSPVKLTYRKGDSELKTAILKREKITLNPVSWHICEVQKNGKGSRIGYIKIASFNQNASGAVKEAIDKLREKNVSTYVLDLRNNSGGLFPEGIKIAKIWLDKGVIVYICDNKGVRDIYDTDGSEAVATSEPLLVLVNKGTASASEILAAALKDNKRAILFGDRTYGKGKIQSVFELSDGSGLVVTVARYETPAHTDIDKVGVSPDYQLPETFPMDGDDFCECVENSSSACNIVTSRVISEQRL